MIDKQTVIDVIAEGGALYADVRDQIRSGDLLALHDAFTADWYGAQIAAVQMFTGPFAHIAQFDRIVLGERERLVVYESVVPDVRAVLVSTTAKTGFFHLSLNAPMSDAERDAAWAQMGAGEYSKIGAIEAGADRLPINEDSDSRRWCAKLTNLLRRMSGIDLGPRYVPTSMVQAAIDKYGAKIQYVRMR